MLHNLRPCDIAALIDMTDNKDRNVKALTRAQKQVCRFAHLNYAAGGR